MNRYGHKKAEIVYALGESSRALEMTQDREISLRD